MIDTLKIQKRLVGAGIEPAHAEAITESLAEQEGGLVTKDYLNARLAEVETRVTKVDSKLELLLWMWPIGIVLLGIGLTVLGWLVTRPH